MKLEKAVKEKWFKMLERFSEANGAYFVTMRDRDFMEKYPVDTNFLNLIEEHQKAGHLRCGVCDENLIDSKEIYQATLPYGVPLGWRPSGKINIVHQDPQSVFKQCKTCHTLPFIRTWGTLAVVYVCTLHSQTPLTTLIKQVRYVPRFSGERVSLSIKNPPDPTIDTSDPVEVVSYVPVTELRRVHFDTSRLKKFRLKHSF